MARVTEDNLASTLCQDSLDLMILTILDKTADRFCGVAPPFHKGEALRVMKQAVREVLWKYRRQYAGTFHVIVDPVHTSPVSHFTYIPLTMLYFTGMLSNQKSVEVHMVTKVAREMCSDGIINWGRIVSLVAFGEVLCRALKTTLGRHCAHEVGVLMAAYLIENHKDWLIHNDAWVCVVVFVPYTL